MNLTARKLAVGLVVLGALVALYAGYAQIGGTRRADLPASEPLPILADQGVDEPDEAGGRIGTTEIETIRNTQFLHRDENGRVDREFGFEVFLHKQGDRWRFTDPYMKLFLPKFQCHVTADSGEVQVETVFGQAIPNDALFEGNVVIHVIPPQPNDPRECFIHLDDVTFVAEKSLFTSAGPVRFVSRSAMLEGTGMELVYDRGRSRLELFRIVDLKSLRIRSADVGLFSGERTDRSHPQAAQESQPPATVGAATDTQRLTGDRYECVFRRNVVIDTPEGVVVAQDLISINNILWSSPVEEGQTWGSRPASPVEPNGLGAVAVPGPDALDTKASAQLAFDAMPVELFDIVVTCDGGCIVAPQGVSARLADPNEQATQATASTAEHVGQKPQHDLAAHESPADRTAAQSAIGKRIEYDAITGDAAFVGPVRMHLQLDPNDLAGSSDAAMDETGAGRSPYMPMTVTADDTVRFISASNQVFLEGDCVATVEKADSNGVQILTLSAPIFVLDLAETATVRPLLKVLTLKRFSTAGGPACLVVRKQGGRTQRVAPLLGWTRVLASRLEYEAVPPLFTAHGPGELQFHNAGAETQSPSSAQTDANALGFDRPCYAFLRDFDLLTFSSDTNRIVVSAEPGPILFDYIPVIAGANGSPATLTATSGQHIWGDAGHLELTLQQAPSGRMELASAVASEGITYEDRSSQFIGDTLTYDTAQSLVTVTGDEVRPCYFNGALVDQIEVNVRTGALKTRLEAPSTFQGRQ